MRPIGIYKDIPIDEYHSDEGISSSGISLILDCPRRYWDEYLSPKAPKLLGSFWAKERDEFLLGRAVHMKTLEPGNFDKHFYCMSEHVDLRTKEGKQRYGEAEDRARGGSVLRVQDAECVKEISESVLQHSLWKKVNLFEGNVEHSVYWDAGLYNTRLRSRPDFYNDDIIIDLKTTDSIANFGRSLYNYGYHRQAAMQIDGLYNMDGKQRHFAFFVVEKKAPYLTSCFTLDEDYLAKGRQEYMDAAVTYSECLESGEWPGYEEKFRLINLPKWLMKGDDNE